MDNSADSGNLSTSGGSGEAASATSEVTANSTSTTTDRTALTYDETNDYIYYEDGEYPQDEARINWNYTGDVGANTSLEISYDENTEILTVDGLCDASMNGCFFFYIDGIAFEENQEYIVSVELISGSVSYDYGNECITIEVCNYDNGSADHMDTYGTRNNADVRLSYADTVGETYSTTLVINSTSAEYGNGFIAWFWVDASGSTATFNNAQYKITISYSDLLEDAYDDGDMTYEYSLDEGGYTATVYSNDVQVADAAAGTRFARVEVGSTVKWFAVEPIRWIVAYGESLPTTLTAVSEKVLSVGSYASSTSYNLTYQSLYTATSQSSTANTSSGALGWSVEDSVTYDAFNSSLSQTTVYSANLNNATSSNTTITSGGYRVASAYEIEGIGGNFATESTAFVAFILSGGTSTTTADVDYWTRDLAYSFSADSNYGASIGDAAATFSGTLGNGVYVTKVGTLSNADFTNTFGARFSTLTTLALCTDDGEYLLEDYEVDSSYLNGSVNSNYSYYYASTDGWELGQTFVSVIEVEWTDLTFTDEVPEATGAWRLCFQFYGNVTGYDGVNNYGAFISFNDDAELSFGSSVYEISWSTTLSQYKFVYCSSRNTTATVKVAFPITITDEMLTNSTFCYNFRFDGITGGTIVVKSLDIVVI